MEPKIKVFEKFTALIILTKKNLFGLNNASKIIWLTANLKIIKSDDELPFKKGDFLDLIELKNFIIKNDYAFNFKSKNSFLKRELYSIVEDINLINIQKKKYDYHFKWSLQ